MKYRIMINILKEQPFIGFLIGSILLLIWIYIDEKINK